MLRAHPLTETYALPASPLLLALVAGATALAVALLRPGSPGLPGPGTGRSVDECRRPLPRAWLVPRIAGVGVLAVVIAAGRLGADDQLENLAPALALGVLWPLLFLASAVLGPVWRYVDPWDSLARVLGARDDDPGSVPPTVWPAVPVALAWAWYLAAYPDPLSPRAVGLALALHTVVAVAGCLALGRVRWLSTAEPLGILLRWTSLVPRRRIRAWAPPSGAEALLGVVAGGLVFALARHTELWGTLNAHPRAGLLAAAGLVGSCVLVSGALVALRQLTLPGGRSAAVARAVVPLVAALVVVVGMERNRLTTSLQLLPGLLGDPFGRGWDLLGPAGAGLDPAPLGVSGLMVAQLAVVGAGIVAGAVVGSAGSGSRTARLPPALAVALLADAGVLMLTVH